jgi:hypothetical protein
LKKARIKKYGTLHRLYVLTRYFGGNMNKPKYKKLYIYKRCSGAPCFRTRGSELFVLSSSFLLRSYRAFSFFTFFSASSWLREERNKYVCLVCQVTLRQESQDTWELSRPCPSLTLMKCEFFPSIDTVLRYA